MLPHRHDLDLDIDEVIHEVPAETAEEFPRTVDDIPHRPVDEK